MGPFHASTGSKSATLVSFKALRNCGASVGLNVKNHQRNLGVQDSKSFRFICQACYSNQVFII